jgi:hypothetical protein
MTRRRHLVLLGVAVALAAATAAWAYWTATGSGAASAGAGTLGAPSGVSASASAGSSTVQLAWTGSTLSTGQPPDGYYAIRVRTSDGAQAAACGTSPSALTASTACNDPGVPDDTYRYVVTAVYKTWTAESGQSNAVTVLGDTAAPAITIGFPQDGQAASAAAWPGGCPTTGLCGAASDPSGVAAVSLSVRQGSSGLYWGGSSFNQASETFVPATGTTSWALAFARPPDGSYTLHVRASDGLGNTTPSGSYATADFTVDTAAPALASLQLFDANGNGKVDQVKATFSEPLASSTATAPWTLSNVPSSGSLASVATAGTVATLTLNEGAGAANTAVGSFTVALAANAAGVRDAAGNQASFAATAPADKAAPALLSLQMLDNNANGRVDRVTAGFSETLSTYSAGTAPWTLANVPSGGTLSGVSVSGTTATLTISEGAAAPETAVGGFTVALAGNAGGIRDAAANLSSFAATAPSDGAAPVLVGGTLQMLDANGNGKVDRVTATFSEALAASTATAPWTLTNVPSSGTLATVGTAGAVATLTLNEGAGAASTAVGSFSVQLAANAAGIRDAAGNQASFSSTTPADKAAPALLSLQMLDNSTNGKVDRVTAGFSETLSTYSAGTAPWTLANVPSSGTLASVGVSGTTATLTITEGAGAQDTAVGGFTVALAGNASGVRDVAANLAAFAATAPADGASPVVVSLASSGGVAGRMEAGDQLAVTFSEPLLASSLPASTTVSERDPSGSGNDVLNITGVTNGDRDTGSNNYVTANNTTATFGSSTVASSGGVVTVTVGASCAGTGCAGIGTGQGDLSFAPAAGITDAAGNAAAGTFTAATSFRLF